MDEFNKDLCNNKHEEIERRLSSVEQSIKENLTRIYDKLDRPSWAVAAIVIVLSSACVGLAVAMIK